MSKIHLRKPHSHERCRSLNQGERGRGPVVYWMSREQRAQDNWPLLHAQSLAIEYNKPLLVVFCLNLDYPAANIRHFSFLLQGLQEVSAALEKLRIPFFLLEGSPPEILPYFLEKRDAGLLVCDFDPLKIKRGWKQRVTEQFLHQIIEVDGHNITPCWLASQKQEYAAYTFRPKLKRLLDTFLTGLPTLVRHPVRYKHAGLAPVDWKRLFSRIPDKSVHPVDWLNPGAKAAQKQLDLFVKQILPRYSEHRNDPNQSCLSNLSPYLHFGQISAQRIALEVNQANVEEELKDAFLEELIVRRELADNYCFYNADYDSFSGFPQWAKKSLKQHSRDKRDFIYDLEVFETATTHDQLWNAAQRDMVLRGKLHGYLRMYWAKKILEWTDSPQTALQTAQYLNDKYELDGRDPSGYTGVAWSIGGVHDRAWKERPVFGKIRYMNANGCARKFNVQQYVATVNELGAP